MSDTYGISSEDEADFLAATEAAEQGKRKREEHETVHSPKKSKVDISPSTALANRVLKERFGLDSFRLKQEAAITRLLDGGSATIVFPTGAGKSLCYQVRLPDATLQRLLKYLGASCCIPGPR